MFEWTFVLVWLTKKKKISLILTSFPRSFSQRMWIQIHLIRVKGKFCFLIFESLWFCPLLEGKYLVILPDMVFFSEQIPNPTIFFFCRQPLAELIFHSKCDHSLFLSLFPSLFLSLSFLNKFLCSKFSRKCNILFFISTLFSVPGIYSTIAIIRSKMVYKKLFLSKQNRKKNDLNCTSQGMRKYSMSTFSQQIISTVDRNAMEMFMQRRSTWFERFISLNFYGFRLLGHAEKRI